VLLVLYIYSNVVHNIGQIRRLTLRLTCNAGVVGVKVCHEVGRTF